MTNSLRTIGYNVVDAGSQADIWRYAPAGPEGASGEEAKQIYQQPGKPVPPEEAWKLGAEAARPSPIGGRLNGMPQVHIDLLVEQASADTVER
ncbi:hypothetical protein [Methylorubrum podarium]|uniref:hypothetical protein n=1 Tax=Methylorubrum podarium TaxID=200476 RepID=UPI001EE29E67|nr:hypothetical protein [Methylorubrum podarium]GJE72607.1 hypothetical protein CHKEEEPN_4164 [Methylorubrum podarium]